MGKALSERLSALDRRIQEADREALRIYRPSVQQEPIHRSRAHELVIYGGKRSGKSTAAVIEFASRVTGQPVLGRDGQPYPTIWSAGSPEDPRTYWIIGIDVTHIGKTVHRLLFQKGMGSKFRCIRDADTGAWRAYNKAQPADVARHKHSRLCGAAIPQRFIPSPKSWAWKRERSREFLSVRLSNGSIIYAFPSSARTPAMGDAVDGIWINEDILYPEYLAEWQDRLNDTDGWLIWDAYAQMYNDAIAQLLDRADAVADDPDRDIEAVQLIYTSNEYITDEAKERALGRMGTEDEITRRNRGELLTSNYAMYDFFPALHVLERRGPSDSPSVKTSPVRQILERHLAEHGRFPAEWSRYLSIDPAHTRTAILSLVVTPREWHGILLRHRVIVEWDLVLLKALGITAARAIAERMGLHTRYRCFIMDKMKGQQSSAQEGRNTFQVWSAAFQEAGLASSETGYGFIPGLPSPLACATMVRQMLATVVDETPMLLFCADGTIATRAEFKTFRKKIIMRNGVETILDEAANPRKHDCMAALQYGVAEIASRLAANTAFQYEEPVVKPSFLPNWFEEVLNASCSEQHSIHLGPGTRA